jgi:hypothetical protein
MLAAEGKIGIRIQGSGMDPANIFYEKGKGNMKNGIKGLFTGFFDRNTFRFLKICFFVQYALRRHIMESVNFPPFLMMAVS